MEPTSVSNTANEAIAGDANAPVISAEASLRESILKQVEFYFSRQNLSNDTYLVSRMNSELFVPISVIASFKMVKALTTDEELLAKVMRTSSVVTVDPTGKFVKPNIKLLRNTLILRDIPADVTPDEIKSLFTSPAPTPLSVRPDIGYTWFVSFEDEETALAGLEHVRSQTLRGKNVAARMKSENILKSMYITNYAPVMEGYADYNSSERGYQPAAADSTSRENQAPVDASQQYAYSYYNSNAAPVWTNGSISSGYNSTPYQDYSSYHRSLQNGRFVPNMVPTSTTYHPTHGTHNQSFAAANVAPNVSTQNSFQPAAQASPASTANVSPANVNGVYSSTSSVSSSSANGASGDHGSHYNRQSRKGPARPKQKRSPNARASEKTDANETVEENQVATDAMSSQAGEVSHMAAANGAAADVNAPQGFRPASGNAQNGNESRPNYRNSRRSDQNTAGYSGRSSADGSNRRAYHASDKDSQAQDSRPRRSKPEPKLGPDSFPPLPGSNPTKAPVATAAPAAASFAERIQARPSKPVSRPVAKPVSQVEQSAATLVVESHASAVPEAPVSEQQSNVTAASASSTVETKTLESTPLLVEEAIPKKAAAAPSQSYAGALRKLRENAENNGNANATATTSTKRSQDKQESETEKPADAAAGAEAASGADGESSHNIRANVERQPRGHRGRDGKDGRKKTVDEEATGKEATGKEANPETEQADDGFEQVSYKRGRGKR